MSYQTKRKIMNGIVYAALALTVITVITVSIITIMSSTNHPVTPPPVTTTPYQTNSPDETTPLTSTKPTRIPTKVPQTPTPSPITPTPTPTFPSNNDDPIMFTLPVNGTIMKDFSIELPVFSFTMGDWRTHNGIDISAPTGEGVVSVAQGTVKTIYNHPLMGNTIEIDHGGGLISRYSNLADEMVEGIVEGVSVGGGQLIASVGFTSLAEIAESDHLHFEMELDGKPVDPTVYLDFSSVEPGKTEID